ncbi:putative btb poz domain containing protein [Phaeoacremonium minimum UCRPA7]|uniref:Putative btb poz domain containing protein n=1 Tax=Phaeoacremonium minimum (strain UCR-PA7) TaxID=1286976 RepID=R8BM18_PHAM7|nr:putative btb poz domain containing protein [Phaeoacremonium minimum UCRPA7]EOO00413.1 putative btb poz domain containing protein [Phaeoacremonium minimum UCRPA7]
MVESGDAMPLNEVLSGRTVVIFVGQDKVKWTLPENLLCKHNDFFKKALRGPFMEKDAVINLPDDDPNAFGLFVQWIYALTLKSVEPESIFSDSAPSAVAFTWIFADKYNDRALQDAAITKLHALSQTRLWTEYLYVEEVNHVFEHTQESAPIRTLIARWIAWNSFVGTNKMEELNAWETILRAGNQAWGEIL